MPTNASIDELECREGAHKSHDHAHQGGRVFLDAQWPVQRHADGCPSDQAYHGNHPHQQRHSEFGVSGQVHLDGIADLGPRCVVGDNHVRLHRRGADVHDAAIVAALSADALESRGHEGTFIFETDYYTGASHDYWLNTKARARSGKGYGGTQ